MLFFGTRTCPEIDRVGVLEGVHAPSRLRLCDAMHAPGEFVFLILQISECNYERLLCLYFYDCKFWIQL